MHLEMGAFDRCAGTCDRCVARSWSASHGYTMTMGIDPLRKEFGLL